MLVMAQNATNSTGNNEVEAMLYDGCDAETEYYSALLATGDVPTWNIADVRRLVTETHRGELNYIATDEQDDIIDALVDLDPGYETPDTVRLLFRDIDFDKNKVNLNEGWKRFDLWPLSRGAGQATKADTDVHAKRPIDWTVEEALREYLWGTCGNHAPMGQCIVPAVPDEAANDTATDKKIKTPPISMRGDVARSVLYVYLRYADELGLNLKDCPPFNTTDYAYLSEMLTWHAVDPVDEREIERNDKACARWQGNRNPFVDYPELVQQFYGEPDVIAEGTYTYEACLDIPTAPPTATPNECTNISPGDISIIIFNSDPTDQIVLFPIQPVDEAVGSLFITDRAWDGTEFTNSDVEGSVEVSEV
jgi:endonuclease I